MSSRISGPQQSLFQSQERSNGGLAISMASVLPSRKGTNRAAGWLMPMKIPGLETADTTPLPARE